METKLYREDNKKLHKWFYILLLGMILGLSYAYIMNTKNLQLMYIFTAGAVFLVILYFFSDFIYGRFHRKKMTVAASQTVFYQSAYGKNKSLKITMSILDFIVILAVAPSSVWFHNVMGYSDIYEFYPMIAYAFIYLIAVVVAGKDIMNVRSLDRIDANKNSILFYYEKKLLFALLFIWYAALNILLLAVKKPHFVVTYQNLVMFEALCLLPHLILLVDLFLNKVYSSHFEIKAIEQVSFDPQGLTEIGKGNYATVYKAYIPSLDTIYAVKKLDAKDKTNASRFIEEFETMKKLNHINLVRVYKCDEINFEYIMDYMPYTLADFIPNNELNEEEKISLINQFLDGIEYLHNHGIFHRDLSFGNVMIDRKNDEINLKITDFGLAKHKNDFTKTMSGATIRSTIYDPALSDFKYYTEQNDIYAVGVIISYIYYQDTAVKDRNDEMSKIISKCMELNLSKRYKMISEIKYDMERINGKSDETEELA